MLINGHGTSQQGLLLGGISACKWIIDFLTLIALFESMLDPLRKHYLNIVPKYPKRN